jgi:hypothetical protein
LSPETLFCLFGHGTVAREKEERLEN